MRRKREIERKDEALRAVWASIARFGTGGTTIERVAELGGFSKGVIHYYFASKKDLLLSAFEAYLTAYEDETIALLTAAGSVPDSAAILRAVVDVSLPPFSPTDLAAAELPLLAPGEPLGPRYKARLFLQFFTLAMTDPDFARVAAGVYGRQGEYFAECFASLSPASGREGAISSAVGLMALVDGLSLHRLLGYSPAGLPDHAELVRRLALGTRE